MPAADADSVCPFPRQVGKDYPVKAVAQEESTSGCSSQNALTAQKILKEWGRSHFVKMRLMNCPAASVLTVKAWGRMKLCSRGCNRSENIYMNLRRLSSKTCETERIHWNALSMNLLRPNRTVGARGSRPQAATMQDNKSSRVTRTVPIKPMSTQIFQATTAANFLNQPRPSDVPAFGVYSQPIQP